MAVRRHDARKRTLLAERAIEIAAKIEAWKRFEQDFLYGVTLALQFAEDLRVERPLLPHREQSCAGQDLLSQKCGPLLPRLTSGKDRHCVMRA